MSEPSAINYRQLLLDVAATGLHSASPKSLRDFSEDLTRLFVSLPAIAKPGEKEQQCAWEIHVELRTRITTQRLRYLDGDEATALDSLVKLFQIVREVCRKAGPQAPLSLQLADLLLNRVLRPITASWHVRRLSGKLNPEDLRREFRVELAEARQQLQLISAALYVLATGQTEASWLQEQQPKSLPKQSSIAYDRVLGLSSEDSERIVKEESAEILDRRADVLQTKTSSARPSDLCGLAISGGGIRSATFALGVVQSLARSGILAQVDLLSTVSGGGYTGSLLSSYLNDNKTQAANPPGPRGGQPPFDTAMAGESHAIRYVRNRSKYMQPSTYSAWAKAAGMALYGIVSNLLILGTLVLLAALLTEVCYGVALRNYYQQGNWKSWIEYLGYPLWGVLMLSALTGVVVILLPAFQRWRLGGGRTHVSRVLWLESVAICLASLTASSWLSLLLLPVAAVTWLMLARSIDGFNSGLTTVPWSAVATGIATFAGFLTARGNYLPQRRRKSPILTSLITALLWVAGPLLLGFVYVEIVRLVIASSVKISLYTDLFSWQVCLLAFTWLASVAFAVSCNVNLTSLHRFYRNRLAETFLLRHVSHADSQTIEVTPKDPQPLSQLRSRGATAPYHLINAVVNLTTSSNPELRGRNCDYFLFSKHFCGGPVVGYRKTTACETANPMLDLGTAVAISGAAAAPQMGVASVSGASLLLTLLNIRLGYWLRWPNAQETVKTRGLRSGPGPFYLWLEAINRMNEQQNFLNLSDGGHIENLGIMELLRRRCRYVVAIDGEQDGELKFPSLWMLQRYARIELGTDLEINCERVTWAKSVRMSAPPGSGCCSGLPGDTDAEPESRCSRAHFALGRIVYPFDKVAQQRPIGWLIYVKLSVTGNEPQYVLDYRRRFPDFPHQSTLQDQVFDEDQFEAYRRLGEHVGEDLFADELLDELRYVDAGEAADLKKALGQGQLPVSGWVNALRAAFRLEASPG